MIMKLCDLFTVIKPCDVVIEDCETLDCLFTADHEETFDSLVSACQFILECEVVDVCAGLDFGRDDYPIGCVVISIMRE